MTNIVNDDELCDALIKLFANVFPDLIIQGGADEPFYKAATADEKAVLYFRSNYPRSLLHEMSHYCLSGDRRRQLDDFGYWYYPCGRTEEQQRLFEQVEARPQGLEKLMYEIIGIKFIPSIDDFSGKPPSQDFLMRLDEAYQEMKSSPPPTAKKALDALAKMGKIKLI